MPSLWSRSHLHLQLGWQRARDNPVPRRRLLGRVAARLTIRSAALGRGAAAAGDKREPGPHVVSVYCVRSGGVTAVRASVSVFAGCGCACACVSLSHTFGRTGVHRGQADRVSRQDQKKQAAQQAGGQGSTSRQHTQPGGETVRGHHQSTAAQPRTGAGPRSSSRSSTRRSPAPPLRLANAGAVVLLRAPLISSGVPYGVSESAD